MRRIFFIFCLFHFQRSEACQLDSYLGPLSLKTVFIDSTGFGQSKINRIFREAEKILADHRITLDPWDVVTSKDHAMSQAGSTKLRLALYLPQKIAALKIADIIRENYSEIPSHKRPPEPVVVYRIAASKDPSIATYIDPNSGIEFPIPFVTQKAFQPEAHPIREPKTGILMLRALSTARKLHPFLERNSFLLGSFIDDKSFFSGTATHITKVGPEGLKHLPWPRRILESIASRSIFAQSVRHRTASLARLEADALEGALIRDTSLGHRDPIRVISIGGGTALDTLNALAVLKERSPHVLQGRRIQIEVLDASLDAPRVGQEMIASATQPGKALENVDVSIKPTIYNWSSPNALGQYLEKTGTEGIVAVVSEGALTEYAPDNTVREHFESVVQNLPGVPFMGTAYKDSSSVHRSVTYSMDFNYKEWTLRGLNVSPSSIDRIARSAGFDTDIDPSPNPIFIIYKLTPRIPARSQIH